MFNTILINPLFNVLIFLYAIIPGHSLGVAVIVLTIIIRLLVWPLVNKQLHSQKAMQSLAPDIAEVKKKAKGDKQLESKLLMELYKEKEISPFAALIPLFIQLPLLIALLVVVRDVVKAGEIAKLTYAALRTMPAIRDVIAHPAIFKTTFLGINLAKGSIVLAFAAAAAQLIQTRQLMPKKASGAAKDPSAQAAAISGYIFPVITFVFALELPAAAALYWTVTSLVAIVQQHLVLGRDVREMEETK